MVTGGNYAYHSNHFITHIIVGSLCYRPETYMIWHVNYTSIKNSIVFVNAIA